MTEKRTCTGTTKAGKPCKAPPRAGKDTCISHASKAEKAEAGFGGAENGAKGGEARRVPKLTELLRERVEAQADEILDRLFELLNAQRAVVVGTGPKARVEVVDDSDLSLKAIREIYDRFEGRPRQVAELTGAEGGAIKLEVPEDARSRSLDAARILLEAHGEGVLNGHG